VIDNWTPVWVPLLAVGGAGYLYTWTYRSREKKYRKEAAQCRRRGARIESVYRPQFYDWEKEGVCQDQEEMS
jgi:hypothetical protein